MDWMSLVIRVGASTTTMFAFLALPIVVSALSRGNLITLNQGILIFASAILAALVIVGLIWTV